MLTRNDVKKGDILRCVRLNSQTDPTMDKWIRSEGVQLGGDYVVNDVPNRGSDKNWIDITGQLLKNERLLPLDIFVKVTGDGFSYGTGSSYTMPAMGPVGIKAGDMFVAKRDVKNPYGASVVQGEIVTVIHTHSQYSSNVMLSSKGNFYFNVGDPANFERFGENKGNNKELLRELLAFSKSIPDPKLEPLTASMRLSDLIDLIQEKLNQP